MLIARAFFLVMALISLKYAPFLLPFTAVFFVLFLACLSKWTLLVFAMIITPYLSLNYSGFCFSEMRYLSDEEKIKRAYENKYVSKHKKYEEMIKEHPNCCKVMRNTDDVFGASHLEGVILNRVVS